MKTIVPMPRGDRWELVGVRTKLSHRSKLPGARVFDLVADSLRKASALGLDAADRLALALPASWCVNSPVDSRVFRRWALPPQREVWLALIDLLEQPRTGPLDTESTEAILAGLHAVAPEPTGIEAVSKVLALLLPDAVPLMPPPARSFVLGADGPTDGAAFVAMVDWFASATASCRDELGTWAAAHAEVALSGAQVLDRLLWFDSEGHRHFPPVVE